MRKYFIFILIIFLLAGCTKKDGAITGGQVNNNEKQIADAGYIFNFNNIKISLNEEASSIIESLGQPLESFQAPSCAFQGMDIFYLFPGFELSTYPLDDKHYISRIDFIDDTVSTEYGLYIGSTLDDVFNKYGNDFKQSGSIYTYELGDTSISFVIKNNIVENITYIALVGDQK